jgi:hypothetical protein
MIEEIVEPVPRKQSINNAFGDLNEIDLQKDITPKILNKKVLVYSNIFKILEKVRIESRNINLLKEKTTKYGLIFGYEDKDKVEITNLYSLNSFSWEDVKNEMSTIINHLENSRFDFLPLGIYVVSDNNRLSKDLIRNLINLRIQYSQSMYLYHNSNTGTTSIQRLTHNVCELSVQAEIKSYHEYPINLFNSQYTSKILEDVVFSEVGDVYSLLSSLNLTSTKNKIFIDPDRYYRQVKDKSINDKL